MSKPEISESIKVYIRQRPDVIGSVETDAVSVNDAREKDSTSGIRNISADGKACTYYSATSKTQQTFSVDKYFEPQAQQEELYNSIALPIVESALLGYSVLLSLMRLYNLTPVSTAPCNGGQRSGESTTPARRRRCRNCKLRVWGKFLPFLHNAYCCIIT